MKSSLATVAGRASSAVESLAQLVPIGIFQTDGQGRVTYVNQRCDEIFGLRLTQDRDRGWSAAIHPEDRARIQTQWRADAADGREHILDLRIVRPSGEVRFVHARIVAAMSSAGRVRGYTGTIEDVTGAVRQPAAAPELANRQVQAIFDHALDAIVLTDDSGRFLEANPAACALLGVSREKLLTTRVSDIVPPALREGFEEQWRVFLSAGHEPGEYVRVRPDGTARDVEFRPMAYGLPGMRLSSLRNVTHHARACRGRRASDRRQEILSSVDSAILGASSPLTVIDAVVQRVATLFGALRATVILFDWATRNARMVAAWPLQPTRLGVGADLPMRDDVVGPGALEGRGFITSDLEQVTPRSFIDNAWFEEGARSLIRVPLRAKAGIIGALEISSGEIHAFDDEQLAVAQEVADHAAVAITSARLFEEVQVTSARLVAMSKRLVEVQEIERREVARELHDEIGQELTALKLRLDLAIKAGTARPADALTGSAQLVQDLLSRVRRLSLDLRPPLLDDFGLQKALLAHFERYTAQTTIKVEFASAGLSDQRFAVEVETASFRIVQESLTNVARHAGTDRAEVDVHVVDGRVHVSVIDHGRGFAADRPMYGGVGVSGMHERVALLGGIFHITSSAGGGTTVTAEIPLQVSGRKS